jgi:hypothetical protein
MSARSGAMLLRRVSGLVCLCRGRLISPSWLRMQTYMVRACQSMPQENCWGLVSHRLRSPPLPMSCSQSPPTTVVCGGGGLNTYQQLAADGGRGTASVAPEPVTLRAIKSQVSLEELFPNYAREAFARKVAEERQQWITEPQNAYLSQGLVLYRGAGVSMSIGLPSWNELTHSLTVTMMSCNIHSAARTLEGFRDESRTEALKALLEEVKQRRNPQKPILMMAWAIKDELADDLPSQVAVHLYGRLGGGLSRLWTGLLGGIFGRGFRQLEKPAEIQLPTSPLLEAIVALTR